MRSLLVFVMLLGALSANGPARSTRCDCFTPGVACESIWTTDAAFVGRVLSIATPDPNTNRRWVTVAITEVFKGAAPGQTTVWTGLGGGDCGFDFVVDETYLVFAHKGADGQLSASICSRTRRLVDAVEDLQYLRGPFKTNADLGHVRGIASRYQLDQTTHRVDPRASVPFEGLSLTLQGYSRTWTTKTRRTGAYEFRVPPGDYRLIAHPRDGLYSYPEDGHLVTVADGRACVVRDIGLQPDGRISGRVVDADHRPIARLALELVGEGFWDSRLEVNQWATTNPKGEFEFRPVRPGWHRIAIAYTDRPTTHPIAWLTAEPGILIEAQQRRNIGVVTLPRPFTTVLVTALVEDGAGRPVRDAFVRYWDGSHSGIAGRSDADGRLVVSLLAGRSYQLSANASIGAGPGARYLNAESTKFEPTPGAGPIRLVVR